MHNVLIFPSFQIDSIYYSMPNSFSSQGGPGSAEFIPSPLWLLPLIVIAHCVQHYPSARRGSLNLALSRSHAFCDRIVYDDKKTCVFTGAYCGFALDIRLLGSWIQHFDYYCCYSVYTRDKNPGNEPAGKPQRILKTTDCAAESYKR